MPSSTVNVDIPSTNPFVFGGDGTPIQSNTELELTVTKPIVTHGTSESKAKLDLKVEPLDVKIEPLDLKIEPLKVDTDSKIDVKPLAVDSCATIRLAPLPPIHVEQPYSTHFGFTYMGMELFGFTMSGKSGMFLSSPPKPQHHSVHVAEPHKSCEDTGSVSHPGRHRSGLRVRVNEK
ncbi:MAG: hypothetical protein ABSD75_04625 [Terriglobales bacterium]|jgi:hypothetical protein